MQTVIIAGGLGTRLKSVTGDLPKSLVPVCGRPFIEHQLDLLKAHGLTEVVLCVGYGSEAIVRHLGNGSALGVQIVYSHEEEGALLGTGGALVQALPLLGESFLVLYGDSYLPTAYTRIVEAFQAGGDEAMMTVFRNEGQWDHSNVRTDGERVVFYSKSVAVGEADFIDYGLTAYRRSVLERYRDASMPMDLSVILTDLADTGALRAFEVHERFYEVGKPEGLDDLETYLGTG